MELNILLYTHTDYKDVWVPFFGQIKKYLPEAKIYILVNKIDTDIPMECEVITYDDSKIYTERLKEGLIKLTCEEFLFIHEDMYLYDKPNISIIEKYMGYIKSKKVDSIKLIYIDGNNTLSSLDSTLILNQYSKLSIQPTLISKETFQNKLNSLQPLTIYELENTIQNSGNDFMCKIGGEIKRGSSHYDSLVFPYIATAIVKGKWNYLEYENELENILTEYNIDKNNRGLFLIY
jgi:hypothetical protein